MNEKEIKLPPGPHKNWAIFLRGVLDETGWSREETCDLLNVEIGWLKRALNGEDLDGAYRIPFQKKLQAEWEEFRKDKPTLDAIKFPAYVEDAPWDKYQHGFPDQKLGSVKTLVDSLKKKLKDVQTILEKVDVGDESGPNIKKNVTRKPPQSERNKFYCDQVVYWYTHPEPAFRKLYISAITHFLKGRYSKAGQGLFQLGEDNLSKSGHNEVKYREAAVQALDLFFFGMVAFVQGKNYSTVIALIKRQIENAVANGDTLVKAKSEKLLSNAYLLISDGMKGPGKRKYLNLALASARSALSNLSPTKFPAEWVEAQCVIAVVMQRESTFCNDEVAMNMLQTTETDIRLALKVTARAGMQCPCADLLLGRAVFGQYLCNSRMGKKEEARLLLKKIIPLLTRLIGRINLVAFPEEWADLQCLRGKALMFSIIGGIKKSEKDQIKLLSNAIEAFKYGQEALTMTTIEDHDTDPLEEHRELLKEILGSILHAKALLDLLKSGGTDRRLFNIIFGSAFGIKKATQSDVDQLGVVVV